MVSLCWGGRSPGRCCGKLVPRSQPPLPSCSVNGIMPATDTWSEGVWTPWRSCPGMIRNMPVPRAGSSAGSALTAVCWRRRGTRRYPCWSGWSLFPSSPATWTSFSWSAWEISSTWAWCPRRRRTTRPAWPPPDSSRRSTAWSPGSLRSRTGCTPMWPPCCAGRVFAIWP